MTITARVQQQFYSVASVAPDALIRLPPTVVTNYAAMAGQPQRPRRASRPRRRTNLWTVEEHERFLRGLEQFPQGPWKEIAAMVGTKTTRQTMTHAQKYRQKIERRQRSSAPMPAENPMEQEKKAQEKPSPKERDAALSQLVVPPVKSECVPFEASSPTDAGIDFFDPSLFDHDLCLLMEDLDPAAMCFPLSLPLSCVV